MSANDQNAFPADKRLKNYAVCSVQHASGNEQFNQLPGLKNRSKQYRLRAFQLVVFLSTVFLTFANEAAAHIPQGKSTPVYHFGANQEVYASFSFLIVLLVQMLGGIYLATILCLFRRGPVWKPVLLASAIQLGIAVPFVVVGFITCLKVLGANLFNAPDQVFLVMPSGIEAFSFIRPEFASSIWLTMMISFFIILGLDYLILMAFTSVRGKFIIAMVHASVMHPLFFPIGQLIGFIHAIYLYRTVDKQHV
jgi:hypothetical protein